MDVEHQDEFIGVREAARRLGIHENTVRNWARLGRLPDARIPGSRFLRFDARDVERLSHQRGASVSSVEGERRTIGPELVDANQLTRWADTRAAQGELPELLRRLLASTPGITNISVPAGDGVSKPGWDGRADSVGTAYLPAGSLAFEVSVERDPKDKAEADFAKRAKKHGGLDPSTTTFVFVTPRRWRGASEWAEARRLSGPFADVKVLDADDLEGWLQATPAVHFWISEHLGRSPRDAETVERWWAQFAESTEPGLPAALFTAGREAEAERVADFLAGPPGVIAVQARWRDDTIAFVAATIDETRQTESRGVQPALLVYSREVWDRVVAESGGMIGLPLFPDGDKAADQAHGHHVILVVEQDQAVRGNKIELPPPNRLAAAAALEAAGIAYERADNLAALARRNMPSVVRTLSNNPRIVRPPWADSRILAPLVLVGGWAQSDQDIEAISKVVDAPWQDIEAELTRWRNSDDRPFVFTGGEWRLASPEEALIVFKDSFTSTNLTRCANTAVEVLTETDPRLDLSAEDRPLAALQGVAGLHSPALRSGLASGVALVGSAGDTPLSTLDTAGDHARKVVRRILRTASEDPSGRTWQTLADVMPRLAEAAPEEFLDAVHNDLDTPQPLLARMFQDGDKSSLFNSSSPHTGLLWALETICWSPDHLASATYALARLQEIDPGGRLANRPIASLGSTLVGWIRQTAAPIEVRKGAVDQICRKVPGVGWNLLIDLLPQSHAVSTTPSRPRFRDWMPDNRGVPISEWVDFVSHLVELAIELAGTDVARWAELVRHLSPLPAQDRERVIGSIEAISDPDSLDSKDRLVLWETLIAEIARHRQFLEADWSLDSETLSRLEVVATRLEPVALPERFAYLFDWRPDIAGIDPRDHRAYDKRLEEMRTEAVESALDHGGLLSIQDLAQRAPVSRHLGWTLGSAASDDLTADLLEWLDSDDEKLREVAAAWASQKLRKNSVSWLRKVLADPHMASSFRREALVLQAPPTNEIWDLVEEHDPELADAYWARVAPWRVDPEDVERATRTLLKHDRPWTAVKILAMNLGDDVGPSAPTSLVNEVLFSACSADPTDVDLQSLGYDVGVLLDYLEKGGFATEKLAQYEFAFFRLLDLHRDPRALYQSLSADPSLFVDLVRSVYRGRNESKRNLTQRGEAWARQAWWVLDRWDQLPGLRDDEAVDGEHLWKWVRAARLAFSETGHADIGDEQIGQVLSASPFGEDEIWPAEPVREIIETLGSTSLETGFYIGARNARGVTSRGLYDGGDQERDLARQFRGWATAAAGGWPRTSRLLRGIAESYERDAREEDAHAALRADS